MNSLYERQPGDLIAHYRIQRWLGAGAEGSVYLVRDLRDGTLRTIKVLRGRNRLAEAEHTVAHYRKLASAPSLKRFREWGVLEGQCGVGDRPWMSFDYIRGETLAKQIDERRAREPLRVLIAVCEALVPIHRRGLAIGDFDRERNLLVEKATGRIKFCDLDAGGPDESPPREADDVQELLRLARRMWRMDGVKAREDVLAVLDSSANAIQAGQCLRRMRTPIARPP